MVPLLAFAVIVLPFMVTSVMAVADDGESAANWVVALHSAAVHVGSAAVFGGSAAIYGVNADVLGCSARGSVEESREGGRDRELHGQADERVVAPPSLSRRNEFSHWDFADLRPEFVGRRIVYGITLFSAYAYT
eukprot:966389-Rhodomonas_salina.1